jgi:hypothetical protein
MSALIKEKEICSTSSVDIWCVIDFMEKAGSDGVGFQEDLLDYQKDIFFW